MESEKTAMQRVAEAVERMANARRNQEIEKEHRKILKRVSRELLHEQKEWMMLGWHKPLPSKPVTRQKAAPHWFRVRSFCQRRRPPDAKC